jgi:hypothetical protein
MTYKEDMNFKTLFSVLIIIIRKKLSNACFYIKVISYLL